MGSSKVPPISQSPRCPNLSFRNSKLLNFLALMLIFSCFYFLSTSYKLKHLYPTKQNVGDNLTAFKSLIQVDVVLTLDEVLVPIETIVKGEKIILPQNDKRIINYIRKQGIMHPPSTLTYNLTEPDKDPSMGQGQFIRKYLKNKRNGFFVECGALDGETRSNTLYMEKELGWQGLLVEGDPKNFKMLLEKRRKSWAAEACLSLKPYPQEVLFMQEFNMGKIIAKKSDVSEKASGTTPVLCFPLFTLLSYINIFEVDYFSLDVEGNELDVLQTIPFDKVFIKTLSVEFFHTEGGKSGILKFMQAKNYHVVETITHPNNLANDLLFVHSSLLNS